MRKEEIVSKLEFLLSEEGRRKPSGFYVLELAAVVLEIAKKLPNEK